MTNITDSSVNKPKKKYKIQILPDRKYHWFVFICINMINYIHN